MEGADFDFNSVMDFSNMGGFVDESAYMKPVEGNTSAGFFFGGDEGIDTTTSNFDLGYSVPHTQPGYLMQPNLAMDNTMEGPSVWNSHSTLSLSPATRLDDFSQSSNPSFDSLSMYQPQARTHQKRSLQLDVQDFPQPKRHESVAEYGNAAFSPFIPSASITGSSWTMETQPTPSSVSVSVSDIGLSDEAADVCALWFSKYAVLPSDRHIESLSQLTGESHNAIRHWFGQMLKQGMAGHDSAYKSQTSLSLQEQGLGNVDISFQTEATDIACEHDTQTASSPPAARGGRKGCKPTTRPDLLSRDPNKIYQCTRKCGKRYGRKCDWKRNEEEFYPSKSWVCTLCKDQGMEKVKPCFRRYHFSQHFRNIHPGLNSIEYEAASLVHSDTSFPRKCGFCPHRFKSRQERIDHIADHFKEGKCMLDWNDDDDENADSDNMDDDDDDRPDSDGFEGPSDDQQDKDAQGRPHPKQDGSGSNGRGGRHDPGGFGQFQIIQFNNCHAGNECGGVDQPPNPCAEQGYDAIDNFNDGTESDQQCSWPEQYSPQEQCSLQEPHLFQDQNPGQKQCSSGHHARDGTAERNHTNSVARDVIAGALADRNSHKQTSTESDDRIPTSHFQQGEADTVVTNKPLKQKVDGSFSELPSMGVAATLEDGGPVSDDSSFVLPVTDAVLPAEVSVTDAMLPEKATQANRKLNVGSCLLAESQPEIPRDRLRLLTLEGGGVRDSTLLLLLEHLMSEFNNEDQTHRGRARLRDFFDAIGGPSTGGLFATMLGRIGMEPAAIFDLVGEMSRASKEQLICAASTSLAPSTEPSPPPSLEPSDLDKCVDLASATTRILQAVDAGPVYVSKDISPVCDTGRQSHPDASSDGSPTRDGTSDENTNSRSCTNISDQGTQDGQDVQDVATGVPDAATPRLARRSSLPEFQTLIDQRPGLLSTKSQAKLDGSYNDVQSQLSILGLTSLASFGARAQTDPVVCMTLTTDVTTSVPDAESKGVPSMSRDWVGLHASHLNLYQKSESFLSMKLLGTGGFSTVDEVLHRETNLQVCRKTLKNRDPSAIAELKKEVSVLQKLRHPHIIRFLGAYSKGDKLSILVSPVAETTLAVWLEKSLAGSVPGLVDTVVKMFGCLVSSIQYLHEQRPVVKHMDIKPQNILVMMGNQEFPHIVLSDFGVSSSEKTSSDDRSKPLTRQYCAPEVPSGIAREQAADIWSLGCVFVEMAATAFGQSNPQWLEFRKEFGGGEGRYYWQDVVHLHKWLLDLREKASTGTETKVLITVSAMLNAEPTERPDAASLTTVFTPAPCCLHWANEQASYPGPAEELEMVETVVRDDSIHFHAHGNATDKQNPEPFARARSWLDECSHDHEACHGQVDTGFLPTRLVDLEPQGLSESIRIVDSVDLESQPNYAVINHVWGPADLTRSRDRLHNLQSVLTRDMLPPAVNDAMTTASQIGYRYIWVDSLCIPQDSQEEKRREFASMASVYRNAALTIVTHASTVTDKVQAIQGKDGGAIIRRSGQSDAHGPPLSSNDLLTAASAQTNPLLTTSQPLDFVDDVHSWSLQSRLLSRRLLLLAGEQMYWECNALKASETFPQGLPPLVWEKVHTRPSSALTSPSLLSTLSTTSRSRVGGSITFRRYGKSGTQTSTRRSTGNNGKHGFQASRWRYCDSRVPLSGKEGAGLPAIFIKDRNGSGEDFHFDFDFEAPLASKKVFTSGNAKSEKASEVET